MSSRIAFKQEELKEAKKDFVGQIIDTDYAMEPFGIAGAPGIRRTGPVLAIKIRTDAYEKDQFEWYPPSDKKKTKPVVLPCGTSFILLVRPSKMLRLTAGVTSGVKWAYFLETLTKTGAMNDVKISGTNDEERMKSFAASLIGMKARFIEYSFESMVKLAGGVPKMFDLIVMEEYLGKAPVEAEAEVRTAEVGGEVAAPATAEEMV